MKRKKNAFTFHFLFILLIFGFKSGTCQNTDDIKIFKFSASGHIGDGRAADYLPCYEPFYFKVNTLEMPGKRITSVKIWIYDSQGKKTIAPSTKTNGPSISTALFTNASNTYSTASLYTDYGLGRQARMFSSIQSTENEMLIYINVSLDYMRYYYMEYEISFVSEGINSAKATAIINTNTVSSINITDGGSNYFISPTVAITGGGGSGATATAAVTGGKITSLSITNPGTGYTATPDIAFFGTLQGNTRIYSTALKQDITFVEAYTGLGLVGFGVPKSVSSWQPAFTFAAGAKIHIKPVYYHPMRHRYSLYHAYSRTSVTVGAVIGKLNYKSSEIKEISDFINPVFGVDFEPHEYFSIHVGAVLGMQEPIYTSSTQKKLVTGLFIGINLTPNVFTQAGKNSSGFKFPTGVTQ